MVYPLVRQQADRKRSQREKLGGQRNGFSPIFSLASVLGAGGKSRLCASLRPLGGAKNAALTNLPLRSCVASSYRKSVRKKWGRLRDLGGRYHRTKPPGMVGEGVETGWRASHVDEGTVRLSSKGESDRIIQRRAIQIRPAAMNTTAEMQ